MSDSKYEPVVFETSTGEVISNDPVWKAKQQLAEAGVEEVDVKPYLDRIEQLEAENFDLRAQLEAALAEDETEDDEEGDADDPYSGMSGKDLKALAAERGVDISGLKKVSEVRAALVAADEAAAE